MKERFARSTHCISGTWPKAGRCLYRRVYRGGARASIVRRIAAAGESIDDEHALHRRVKRTDIFEAARTRGAVAKRAVRCDLTGIQPRVFRRRRMGYRVLVAPDDNVAPVDGKGRRMELESIDP